MTKEELEKATGKELIEQRNYCGVDGYYGDYLDNVNAEMLKRFNRLAELEKENAELKKKNLDTQDAVTMQMYTNKANKEIADKQLTKAKEMIKYLCGMVRELNKPNVQLTNVDYSLSEAEQFLREVEK